MSRAILLLVLAAGAVRAEDQDPDPVAPPPVVSIRFEGNDTTEPRVMLREMVLGVGDPADPARIERSRQGIQDLGLFRSVDVRQEPADGGVALVFAVREKWYLLPIPRADVNSEGESAYGLALRWFNVAGLNHTLRATWSVRDEEKANKGESTNYSVGYTMPFVFDSPYGVGLFVGHSEQPVTLPIDYVETVESAGVSLSRTFSTGPASQGWTLTGTLDWARHDTEGPAGTPEANGQATSLGLSSVFHDVRYHLYSEEGARYGGTVRGASEGLGSDYSYASAVVSGTWYQRVGETPHQNVNLTAAVGSYHGGPTSYRSDGGAYSLGGASVMRGYPADFVVGDFYYYAAVEYLRPLLESWIRPVVVLEAGNAFAGADRSNGRVYASLGLGLRLRFTFLVNFEFEAGVAWPLDGGGQRFFASKV